MKVLVLAVALLTTGCAGSIIQDLAKDPNQHCWQVSSIYVTASGCRGAEGSDISMPGGQMVKGNRGTNNTVTVPVDLPPHTMTLTPGVAK